VMLVTDCLSSYLGKGAFLEELQQESPVASPLLCNGDQSGPSTPLGPSLSIPRWYKPTMIQAPNGTTEDGTRKMRRSITVALATRSHCTSALCRAIYVRNVTFFCVKISGITGNTGQQPGTAADRR